VSQIEAGHGLDLAKWWPGRRLLGAEDRECLARVKKTAAGAVFQTGKTGPFYR
jgi:hypothetical protein